MFSWRVKREIALLGSPNAAARAKAATALGSSKNGAALDPLLAALASERDVGATRAIARALGLLGDKKAAGPLIAMALDPHDQARQHLAIESLEMIGGSDAADALLKIISNNYNSYTKTRAINALGEIKDLRAVQPLIAVVEDWIATVAKYGPDYGATTFCFDAVSALAAIGDLRAAAHLAELHELYANHKAASKIAGCLERLLRPHLLTLSETSLRNLIVGRMAQAAVQNPETDEILAEITAKGSLDIYVGLWALQALARKGIAPSVDTITWIVSDYLGSFAKSARIPDFADKLKIPAQMAGISWILLQAAVSVWDDKYTHDSDGCTYFSPADSLTSIQLLTRTKSDFTTGCLKAVANALGSKGSSLDGQRRSIATLELQSR